MSSWIDSANAPLCPFPVQNLPYGVFSLSGSNPRCGVAIGDRVLDLTALAKRGLLDFDALGDAFAQPTLNPFIARGAGLWQAVRERLTSLLSADGDPALKNDAGAVITCLHPRARARMHLPFTVTEYTDFYAGRQHAFNVGTMFRGPENALPPNWLHIPIGYNGRASSVVVTGTDFPRPVGQLKAPDATLPQFAPCERLDYELEFGAVVGTPTRLGQQVSVAEADRMIFGYVLLNDWSARDIQAWEYQPLGPFQSKAFATTISPWVVPAAALDPFRIPAPERAFELLPYLRDDGAMHYDINLEVSIRPQDAPEATTITRSNCRHLYYSSAQQLAHHASSGCPMRVGDLLGSGTISGPEKEQFGSLLELTWGGRDPLTLKTGEQHTFIEDGDTITITGWADGDGYRIGFGECAGKVLPAATQFDT